jgi:hypothetical protein
MIPLATRIAAGFVAGPRAQKALAWFFVTAFVCLAIWFAYLLIAGAMNREVDDRVQHQTEQLDAITNSTNAAAEREAARDLYADEMARVEERGNIEEAINASERDPDGDPLGAAMRGLR